MNMMHPTPSPNRRFQFVPSTIGPLNATSAHPVGNSAPWMAWTGIPGPFLASQPTGPHPHNRLASKSNIWCFRRDLRHLSEGDSYGYEPTGPDRPFCSMEFEDVKLKLYKNPECSSQWAYKHWTWSSSLFTDLGFDLASDQLYDSVKPSRDCSIPTGDTSSAAA